MVNKKADINIDFKAYGIREGTVGRETVGLYGSSHTVTLNDSANNGGASLVEFVSQHLIAKVYPNDYPLQDIYIDNTTTGGLNFDCTFDFRILGPESTT